MESFIALNVINFSDIIKREEDVVLWDVRRVSITMKREEDVLLWDVRRVSSP